MKHNTTWCQNKSLIQQLEETSAQHPTSQGTAYAAYAAAYAQVYAGIGEVEFVFISNG